MQLNTAVKKKPIHTHEGAKALRINPELQLRRSVMSCLLFENEFYEDGQSIAQRIAFIIPKVAPEKVSQIAVEAREQMKLRHVPLLIVREMARLPTHRFLVANTLSQIIQRPDELNEFLAIYWKDGREPLSAQVKKGLARAFTKFNAYSLAKYNRPTTVKLKDVLFLCHAKPKDKEQEGVWKKLVDGTLEPPDTWEVALSKTDEISKKDKWERLLKENKLGALALLRNLRNFNQEKVDESLVRQALKNIDVARVLPFRFISAAKHAVHLESEIEEGMLKCLLSQEKLPGHTILLLDVSGSMAWNISEKSDLSRMDAACAVGVLLREICESVSVFTFSNALVQVPARRGFALRDAIVGSQPNMGTYLGKAVKKIMNELHNRLIVITDEQSHDQVPIPSEKSYLINVASNKNGIGYGKWLHIDGWSEAVIDYIREYESSEQQ